MTQSPNPIHQPEASEAEEDAFEVWFEQYRMQSWLSAGCGKDRGPQPSAAWGLGSRQSLLRGWLARAALAATPPDTQEPPFEWYCERHPDDLMGHDGCAGAGIPEGARIEVAMNLLKQSQQETREAISFRDDVIRRLESGAHPAQVGTSGAAAEVAECKRLARAFAGAFHNNTGHEPSESLEYRCWDEFSAALDRLATMSSPAAKVGTEDADAQAETQCEHGARSRRMCSICSRLATAPQPPEAMAPAAPACPFYCAQPCQHTMPMLAAPVAAVGEAAFDSWWSHSGFTKYRETALAAWEAAKLGRETSKSALFWTAEIADLRRQLDQPRSSPLTVQQYNAIPELCAIRPSLYESVVRAIEVAHGIVPDPSLQTR